MNIEEAYIAMREGHKVAHESYSDDEFNFMEGAQIRCEQGCYWGLKGDTPWQIRVHSDWAQEGWFICDERELKPKRLYKFQNDIAWDIDKYYQMKFMPANPTAVAFSSKDIRGKTHSFISLDEPYEKIKERTLKNIDVTYPKTSKEMFELIKESADRYKELKPMEFFLAPGGITTDFNNAMSKTTELTVRDFAVLVDKIKESRPTDEEIKEFNKKLLIMATPEEKKIIEESLGVPKEYKFADTNFLSAMCFDYFPKENYKNNKDGSMGFTIKKNRELNKTGIKLLEY